MVLANLVQPFSLSESRFGSAKSDPASARSRFPEPCSRTVICLRQNEAFNFLSAHLLEARFELREEARFSNGSNIKVWREKNLTIVNKHGAKVALE